MEWQLDRLADSGIPILNVAFPDDLGKDVIHFTQSELAVGKYDPTNEESCIFEGYLRNERESYAVATGCPGSRVEVSI